MQNCHRIDSGGSGRISCSSDSTKQPPSVGRQMQKTVKNGNFTGIKKNHYITNGMKFVASTKFFAILRKGFVSEQCHKCIK
jgi:hypothetical protein